MKSTILLAAILAILVAFPIKERHRLIVIPNPLLLIDEYRYEIVPITRMRWEEAEGGTYSMVGISWLFPLTALALLTYKLTLNRRDPSFPGIEP